MDRRLGKRFRAFAAASAVLVLAGGCGSGEVEGGFARAPTQVTEAPAPVEGAGFAGRPAPAARDRSLGSVAIDRPVLARDSESPSGSPDRGLIRAPSEPAAAPAPVAESRLDVRGARELQAAEALEDSPGEAARLYSELILDSLVDGGGGEDTVALERWVAQLLRAQARHRWRALGEWPAVEAKVEPGEGLILLRKRVLERHPGLLICTGLIARANQLAHPEALQPGDVLRVPVEPAHVLVDLSARHAFYCFGGEIADAWPVGIGKPGHETPPGRYTVGVKQERPPWHPRGRTMVPYGDPENPLGSHWIGWIDENGRPTDVGFHGTSDESGVGGEVSSGCLRMRNADVAVLHDILPQGARVVVQP